MYMNKQLFWQNILWVPRGVTKIAPPILFPLIVSWNARTPYILAVILMVDIIVGEKELISAAFN